MVSRCVRRVFLCGEDSHTGKNFDHRRGWLETWILQLAGVFAIDVAAYAVMSNHYHIVLRIDALRAAEWSIEEVLERWTRLFTGPVIVQRYLSPETRALMTESECDKVVELAEGYRERLTNLSWFMRVLNESIAREANREDGVKGRFWEGRFKSQALLDEAALLSAMAYVDLNPIRAGIAFTPEESDHTSIQARIEALAVEETAISLSASLMEDTLPAVVDEPMVPVLQPVQDELEPQSIAVVAALLPLKEESVLSTLPQAPLMPFDATTRFEQGIPFAFADYLELVDTVGRAIRPDKRGAIPMETPKILARLAIDTETFIAHSSRFLKEFGHAVGTPENLIALASKRQTKYLRGIATARALFERKVA
ncbi:transposase [Gammaproteobacteria bacterium]